jgi:hypothetical protein
MPRKSDGDQFVVTFTRGGSYDVSVPGSFAPEDWPILDRVVAAVREAVTGAAVGHA